MNKPIAALYCRVSTSMQVEKGESIDNQKTRLKEYANDHSLKYRIYEDPGISAKDTNRPALKKLLDDIAAGNISTVLVTKLDRITRSIKDLINLLEYFSDHSVDFKSITQPFDTSSAMGRGFLRIAGEFAQIERELVSERVGEDMRQRAKEGKWNGGVIPFGYTSYLFVYRRAIESGLSEIEAEDKARGICADEKQLYINPDEAEIIRIIFNKYLELESLRGVTHWLNSNKYKTRHNKTWATSSIRRILSNPTYVGKIWYNKRISTKLTGKLKTRAKDDWIICDGNHQPIIKKDKFEKVQTILKSQSIEPKRKSSEYLLSGLVRCGKCGATLSGYSMQRKRNGKVTKYAYYKCHNYVSKGRSVCKGNSINKDVLEDIVVEKIFEMSESREFQIDIKKCLKAFNNKTRGEVVPLKQELKKLIRQNEKIDQKKRNLLLKLEDDIIDNETYKGRISELNEEYAANQSRIFHLESKLNDIGIDEISFNSVYESLHDFRANWPKFDFAGKKDLIWNLVSKITVIDKKVYLELFFLPDLFTKDQGGGSAPASVCSRTGRDSWPRPAGTMPGTSV